MRSEDVNPGDMVTALMGDKTLTGITPEMAASVTRSVLSWMQSKAVDQQGVNPVGTAASSDTTRKTNKAPANSSTTLNENDTQNRMDIEESTDESGTDEDGEKAAKRKRISKSEMAMKRQEKLVKSNNLKK